MKSLQQNLTRKICLKNKVNKFDANEEVREHDLYLKPHLSKLSKPLPENHFIIAEEQAQMKIEKTEVQMDKSALFARECI